MKSTVFMGLKVLTITAIFVFSALPIFAAEGGGGAKFPSEITLADAPLTLQRSIDTALINSRMLKENNLDFQASQKKITETRNNFGFKLDWSANRQRVHNDSKFTMGSTYYDVSPIDPSNPLGLYGITFPPQPKVAYTEIPMSKKWGGGSQFDLQRSVYTFGVERDAIDATRRQRDISGLDVEIGRLDLIENVKKSFFNVLLMEELVNVQEEAVKQAETHLAAAKSRFEVGATPKIEVISADVEVASAKEQLTSAIKNLDLVKMAFNNTLGLPVESNTKVSEAGAYEKIMLKPMDFYLDMAYKNRPEIKKLKAYQELTLIGKRLNKNKPAVGLSGNWTFYNRGSGLFGSEHTWYLAMGAQFRVFDNGISQAKIAQSDKTYKKLLLNETDLREGIALEVKQAYMSIIEAGQRIETSAAIYAAAEEGYRIRNVGFKEGVSTGIELLDAEHQLTQARLGKANANFDYEIQKARLARACGVESLGVFDSELQDWKTTVNKW